MLHREGCVRATTAKCTLRLHAGAACVSVRDARPAESQRAMRGGGSGRAASATWGRIDVMRRSTASSSKHQALGNPVRALQGTLMPKQSFAVIA